MDRAARAAACNLRPFWARVVSVEGAVRWVIVTGCALGVCASAAAIYGDLTGGADAAAPHAAAAALLAGGGGSAVCCRDGGAALAATVSGLLRAVRDAARAA